MILKDIAENRIRHFNHFPREQQQIRTNQRWCLSVEIFLLRSHANRSGEDISSREVKISLKECIENENPSKPLTDEHLTALLNEKGYIIARRTVAKYREQLNIPVARLRKKI